MTNRVPSAGGFDVGWLQSVWERRKWLALAVFAAVITASLSVITFLPKVYRSTATLLVEGQHVPERLVKSTVTSGVDSRIRTITQDIATHPRLRELIVQFDPYPETRRTAGIEAAMQRMRNDIDVNVGGLRVRRGVTLVSFAVSYRGSDPHVVATITNAIASLYVEENAKVREARAKATTGFIGQQVTDATRRLEEAERRWKAFREAHVGELPEDQAANAAALERLSMTQRLNSEQLIRARERRAALLAGVPVEVPIKAPPPPPPDTLQGRLDVLRRELTELSVRFSEKYPDVIRIKAEIAALEAERRQRSPAAEENGPARTGGPTTTTVESPVLKRQVAGADAEIATLVAESQRLSVEIADYKRRLGNSVRAAEDLHALVRERDTAMEAYRTFSRRYEDASLAESLEEEQQGEQFRILEPAMVMLRPAAPKRPQLILVGVLLSCGLAVAAALVAERLDDSFHSVDDVRASSKVPVLASIPRIETPRDVARERRRFGLKLLAGTTGLVVIVALAYPVARGTLPVIGSSVQKVFLRY